MEKMRKRKEQRAGLAVAAEAAAEPALPARVPTLVALAQRGLKWDIVPVTAATTGS